MIDELFYTKTTHGWRVYDREGNAATGATKQLARNQYYLLYKVNKEPKIPEYDMSSIVNASQLN